MTIWLDNHLSPALAGWTADTFGRACVQVRDLDMARASDPDIFRAARIANAVLITKDADFAELVSRLGAPPAIILLSCGNTSDRSLRTLLVNRLPRALSMIEAGDALVEIGGDT